MSPTPRSREGSRERSESRLVRHQHSFSESGRSSVPMWDSSDPDRAPPPLPINPAVGSPVTRSNTSARIEEAAALIQARARENAPSGYTSNPPPSPSPEKSPVKAQHRRMQTLQGNNVGRISDSLERRSPEKGLRASKTVDFEEYKSSRLERSPTRPEIESPTPSPRKPAQSENTPPASTMLALQSIRNRQEPAPPLADITNGSSTMPAPSVFTMEGLSSQILNITSIATNLQREMNNLSKRSKDNASDLNDLRKATNARDEDIRNSLKELVAGLDTHFAEPHQRLLGAPEAARSASNLGLFLDDKDHLSTPGRSKFTLPRIASPSSFVGGLDRDITASPSIACVDGAASIALLEKVLREMATRDGQERIMDTLEAVRSQALVKFQSSGPQSQQSHIDPIMMAKLEEILIFMRQVQDESSSRALVMRAGREGERSLSQNDLFRQSDARGGQVSNNDRRMSNVDRPSSDAMNEEVVKMLKNVKQSLTQGGGLTNEVKTLVRDLRGEVLGMGREIAKKLENAQSLSQSAPQEQGPDREEIAAIVDQALAELKEHMHQIVRDSRRQSAESMKAAVDTQQVVHAVTAAIAQMPRPREEAPRDIAAEREDMIAAVREAWEDCKPEIALEHFGLERDEILETLKEGLKSHQPLQPTAENAGATYEEVLDAVRKGMADFKPPAVETQETVTREEIFAAVREVLENFDWPIPSMVPSSLQSGSELSQMSRREIIDAVQEGTAHLAPSSIPAGSELSRREIVDAVQEGMANQPPVTKEVEFNREDLFDAIKSCLEGEQNPLGGMGERVVEAMHEFLSSMKTEFQEYSTANGKDTEQVLDALKDGLEDLRADIESYVDRASDVTGKDEIIDTVKAGFSVMQVDLDKLASRPNTAAANTPELLDAMEKEFEHLRDTISKSMAQSEAPSNNDEILDAIRDLQDDRQSSLSSNSEDIVRLVKEELEHMRATLAGTLVKSGASIQREDVVEAVREAMETSHGAPRGVDGNESILSNTSELLDAFQDGVDNIRADLQKVMDRPADVSSTYEVLDTLKVGIEDVRADISRLQKSYESAEPANPGDQAVVMHDENKVSSEIEGLKVMITQLRIKVEALDSMPAPIVEVPREMRLHKEDLDDIHVAIQGVHATVREVKNAPGPEAVMPANAVCKEDTDAIETLLRNMKAQVDDLVAPDSTAKTVQLEAMEEMLREIKTAVEDASEKSSDSGKVDLEFVELMLKDVQKAVEEIQAKLSGLSIDDDGLLSKLEIGVVESLCADIKTQIDGFILPNVDTLPTKDDVAEVRDSIKAFREQLEADNELTAQAFEARKIEHGGLANKIDDVKVVIGDLRDELMNKLDGSEEGIVELNKVLGMHHDSMSTYASAASIAELSDLVRAEFETQHETHATNKTDSDERSATLFNKHDETSAELKAAIEDKFNELMIKYDDAQASNETKLKSLDERDEKHLETTTSTKVVVDDLKSVMETLGATITETCDRMSGDSNTVFSRVDEASAKIEALHTASALEHGQTRHEVVQALAVATRLEGTIAENQPAIMAALREVLDAVGTHYQHSQQQTESFARATEEIKSGVGSIPTSITGLLPAPSEAPRSPEIVREIPVQPLYDDSQVHDKLNNLISHAATAKQVFANIENHHENTQESLANLEKLDQIHETVMAVATEISSMVATQSRLMAEHHDAKTQEATEAAIALEKRTAQKERVEADIVALNEEKNALVASMAELRREQAELSGQTKKLTREVAKLETALNIRQEEMRDMNARAETLERRIFEGLMNHARTVKAGKPVTRTKITPAERDASMNLRRVPSSASTVTTKTSVKNGSELGLGNAVGMALKKRTPLGSSASVTSRTSNVDRRILSTSHVTGNRGRDTPERQLVLAPAPKMNGFVSLKRSQSVKSNPGSYVVGRKQSWNGVVTPVPSEDKENEEHGGGEDISGDEHSETGTERRSSVTRTSLSRTSLGTSYMYTDSLAYGTGSDLSTQSGRTVSYASSIGGTIDGMQEPIAEEEEEDVPDAQALTLMDTVHEQPLSNNLEAGQDNSMALTHLDSYDTVVHVQAEQDNPSFEPHLEELADPYDEHAPPVETAEVLDAFSELVPPPLITDSGVRYDGKYSHSNVNGSDSGLGTEPPTATEEYAEGEAMEYFKMTAEEQART